MNVRKPVSTRRRGVAACFVSAAPVFLVEVGWAAPVPVAELAPAAPLDEPGASVDVTTADVADIEAVAVPTSTVK